MQLKEALALYGHATNPNSAWGYSPYPFAELLPDGQIKVRTYHMEGEWRERIYTTPEDVDFYLYTDSGATGASVGGKRFEASLTLGETGFALACTIDGKNVSIEEYERAFPQELKEDGEWLPGYWNGPGEWAENEN